VIPTSNPTGTADLPTEATYRMPKPEDIGEEGFGYFRDVWLIKDVPVREARQMLAQERRITEVIDALSDTAEGFDRLAHTIEWGSNSSWAEAAPATPHERAVLSEFMCEEDEPSPLGGLDLGVAGLVYALATVRIMPAASCRGHTGDRAWSTEPVVLFAATERRARALQPLAARTGCVFAIDGARRNLLTVEGRSILDTMALGDAVLANRESFVQHTPQRATGPRRYGVQEPLFQRHSGGSQTQR
jgi:hypothetical protein